MHTVEELERLWNEAPPAPTDGGTVCHITLRKGGGRHETPNVCDLTPHGGITGDRWSQGEEREVGRQVTVMNVGVARILCAGTLPLDLPGDNLLVDLDLSETALPAGTRLRVGETLLEVSELPHLGCGKFSSRFGAEALRWVNARNNRPLRLRGLNCKVIEGGTIRLGDPVRKV